MKYTELETELLYVLEHVGGPLSMQDLGQFYHMVYPDSRAGHTAIHNALTKLVEYGDVYAYVEHKITWYSFHPPPPEELELPELPPSREDMMQALDTLEVLGRTGVMATFSGCPPDITERLLNGYGKGVLPWICLARKVVKSW